MNVRVDDRDNRSTQHFDGRFNRKITLSAGRQLLHIKLADIRNGPVERQMNLRKIDRVVIFGTEEDAGRSFILHEIRLEITHMSGTDPAKYGVPKGIRTPVAAVKGRSPRPLDDGDLEHIP